MYPLNKKDKNIISDILHIEVWKEPYFSIHISRLYILFTNSLRSGRPLFMTRFWQWYSRLYWLSEGVISLWQSPFISKHIDTMIKLFRGEGLVINLSTWLSQTKASRYSTAILTDIFKTWIVISYLSKFISLKPWVNPV